MMMETESYNRLEEYKNALWSFILEHSDIQDSGALFVKFHTSGKKNFMNRVNSRYKYGYHRENVVSKAELQEKLRFEYEVKKAVKKALKEERRKKRKNLIKKLYATITSITKRSWTPATSQTTDSRK